MLVETKILARFMAKKVAVNGLDIFRLREEVLQLF